MYAKKSPAMRMGVVVRQREVGAPVLRSGTRRIAFGANVVAKFGLSVAVRANPRHGDGG